MMEATHMTKKRAFYTISIVVSFIFFLHSASEAQVDEQPLFRLSLSSVSAFAWSPFDDSLAVGTDEGQILRWYFEDDELVPLADTEEFVTRLLWFPEQERFLWSDEYAIYTWVEVEDTVELTVTPDDNIVRWIRGLDLSSDESLVAAADDLMSNSVVLWDVETGEELQTFFADSLVCSTAFSHDNSRLAVGAYRTVFVWDLESGQLINTLSTGSDSSICSLVWVADDNEIVAGSKIQGVHEGDRTFPIVVWDVDSGEIDRIFDTGYEGIWGVADIALSPDGEVLASAAHDGTIYLWDFQGGDLLSTIDTQSTFVLAVAWSPDGHTLASRSMLEWEEPREYEIAIWHNPIQYDD